MGLPRARLLQLLPSVCLLQAFITKSDVLQYLAGVITEGILIRKSAAVQIMKILEEEVKLVLWPPDEQYIAGLNKHDVRSI
jgi:hypothetical protein